MVSLARLPPLNALKGFEASGRHLNFRPARGLALTEEGRKYHTPIQRAFELISAASNELRPQQGQSSARKPESPVRLVNCTVDTENALCGRTVGRDWAFTTDQHPHKPQTSCLHVWFWTERSSQVVRYLTGRFGQKSRCGKVDFNEQRCLLSEEEQTCAEHGREVWQPLPGDTSNQ